MIENKYIFVFNNLIDDLFDKLKQPLSNDSIEFIQQSLKSIAYTYTHCINPSNLHHVNELFSKINYYKPQLQSDDLIDKIEQSIGQFLQHTQTPVNEEFIKAQIMSILVKRKANALLTLLNKFENKSIPEILSLKDINGFRVIHFIAAIGSPQLLNVLLFHYKLDINLQTNAGYTPLNYAINNGNNEVLEILISYGANITQTTGSTSPIFHAIFKNNFEAVKLLIQRKKSLINSINGQGSTPLICAAKHGRLKILKLLIESGADVLAKDKNGCSALFQAIIWKKKECLSALLQVEGVNVNEPHEKGNTPVMVALYSKDEGCLKVLLEHKNLNIEARNKSGQTLLLLAIDEGNIKLIKKLIDKGADFYAKDNFGNSFLDLLIFSQTIPLIEKKEILKIINKKYKLNLTKNVNDIICRNNILHLWGLRGRLSCGNNFYLKEGNLTEANCSLFKNLLKEFIKSPLLISKKSYDFFVSIYPNINDFIDCIQFSGTTEELLSRIDENKPIMVISGWVGHTATLLFYKHHVFKCDRSGLHEMCIRVFKRKSPLTKDILVKIKRFKYSGLKVKEAREYFFSGINEDLGLEECPMRIPIKKQHIGNCGIASLKGAFFEFLFFLAYEKLPHIPCGESGQIAREIFKAFTNFACYSSLKEYLELAKVGKRDYLLLRSIKEKIYAKFLHANLFDVEKIYLNHSLTLIEKTEKEENMKLTFRDVFKLIFNKILFKNEKKQFISNEWHETLKWLVSDVQGTDHIYSIRYSFFENRQTLLAFATERQFTEITEFLLNKEKFHENCMS